jgi:signal transduction histidine kinase
MKEENNKNKSFKNFLGNDKIFKAVGNLGLAVRGTAFAIGAPSMMIAGSALGLASDVALKITAQKNALGDFDLMLSLVEINTADVDVEQQFKKMELDQNLQNLKQKLQQSISPEIKQERLRIAQLMKNDGISLDKISLYTGLTNEEIMEI